MKLHVMMTLAALMFMAPASYAKDVETPPAPTGPNAKGLETTQPSKDMARSTTPSKKEKKKKKSQPLSPKEYEEMERRTDVTEPPKPNNEGVR